jgi:hypothetical protein
MALNVSGNTREVLELRLRVRVRVGLRVRDKG